MTLFCKKPSGCAQRHLFAPVNLQQQCMHIAPLGVSTFKLPAGMLVLSLKVQRLLGNQIGHHLSNTTHVVCR